MAIASSIVVESNHRDTINSNRTLKNDGKGGNNGKGDMGYNEGGGGPELFNKGQQHKTPTEAQQCACSSANKIGKDVKIDKGGGGCMSEHQ